MDEEKHNNTCAGIESLNGKRKRGRPRKDDPSSSDSLKRRPQIKEEDCSYNGNELIGQSVSGVLDGTFDAGYMLTVTVGNTGCVLTGVVFDPDCSIQVSSVNDIAPNIEMLKRSIPSTEQLEQPKPNKNEFITLLKGSSLSPVPCNLNFIPTPSPLSGLGTPKVEISEIPCNPIPDAICSFANLKSSLSSTPCHDSGDCSNLMAIKSPKLLTSEAKETPAIETALQFSASKTVKSEPIETVPQSSACEAKEIRGTEMAPASTTSEAKEIRETEMAPEATTSEAKEIQETEMAPESTASEAKEIQATEMALQLAVSEAKEIQTAEMALQSAASKTKEMQATDMMQQYFASGAKEVYATENVDTEMVPQYSASEAKRVQATENVYTEMITQSSSAFEVKRVQGTENVDTEMIPQYSSAFEERRVQVSENVDTKDFPTDFPGAGTPELLSEVKNLMTISYTLDDIPIFENERLGHPPKITPEVAIQSPEHHTEKTIDFMGVNLLPDKIEETYVGASSKVGNCSNEKINCLLESKPCPAVQELTPKESSSSMLTLEQPYDLNEVFKDTYK